MHCAASLAQLEAGATASAAQLAQYFDLPAAYLAKRLQALVKAGVLAATGPRGGFRLARPASEITLLEIVEAVGGAVVAVRVPRDPPAGDGGHCPLEECQNPCILAEKMAEAHQAWRNSLATTSLAEIIASLPPSIPPRTRLRLTGTP